jgi:hypothetical protein
MIYFLFRTAGASAQMFTSAIADTPWQLWTFTVMVAVLINLASAMRWKVAARWFSPGATQPSIMTGFVSTVLGGFLGMLLPAQISITAVRWATAARTGDRGGWAVSSSLYEQLFYLVALSSATVAGLIVLSLRLGPWTAGLLFAAALSATVLAMRPILRIGAWSSKCIARLVSSNRIRSAFNVMDQVMTHAAEAPRRTMLTILSYSIAQLTLQIGHGVAVAAVFAPKAAPLLVAAGIPGGVLAAAVPTLPGGLGVAEWTWSGLLVLAGATPTSAAIASLASRVLYSSSLAGVSLALFPIFLRWRQLVNATGPVQRVH